MVAAELESEVGWCCVGVSWRGQLSTQDRGRKGDDWRGAVAGGWSLAEHGDCVLEVCIKRGFQAARLAVVGGQ